MGVCVLCENGYIMMLQTISLYFSALFPPSKKFYCIAADGFDCACFRETRTEQECLSFFRRCNIFLNKRYSPRSKDNILMPCTQTSLPHARYSQPNNAVNF